MWKWLSASICFIFVSNCDAARNEPAKISICDVENRAAELAGRRLRLFARYISDRFEHALLVGPGCEASLSLSVDMNQFRHIVLEEDKSSLQAFDEAEENVPTSELAVFDVDVLGILVLVPGQRPETAFIIEKVWSFRRVSVGAEEAKGN